MNPSDRCQRKAHGGFICQHRRDEHTGWSGGKQVLCVHMYEGPGVRGLCSCPGFVEASAPLILPIGTRVQHRRHTHLIGEIAGHEHQSNGELSEIPYRINWDDSDSAATVLGWFWLYGDNDTVQPLTVREQAAQAVTEPIQQILQPVRAKVQIPSDPFRESKK